MKILKFVLWPIILVCLLWTTAIFFGPSIIIAAASHFSHGKINLTRVDVSPKLTISAAVINFDLPQAAERKDLPGVLRALSIDWEIKNGFKLFGSIGPSKLDEYGSLTSANFTLKPTSIFDWREVNGQLEFEQIAGTDFELKKGKFNGVFLNTFKGLKDAKFFIPKISGTIKNIPFEASALSVWLDEYDLTLPPIHQKSQIKYVLKKILGPRNTFGISFLDGDVKLSDGGAVFTILATNAHLFGNQVAAKSIALTSNQSLISYSPEGELKFNISEITLKDPAVSLQNYSGLLEVTPSKISHSGRVLISSIELKNDQYLIGNIKTGILDVSLTSRVFPSKLGVEGQGVLTLNGDGGFSVKVKIGSLITDSGLLNCFGQKCGLETFEADYHVAAPGSSLTGNFKCEGDSCFKRPSQFMLQTKNTNKFFQELSDAGILSPLALPMAYFAISNGEVVGNGHMLNF